MIHWFGSGDKHLVCDLTPVLQVLSISHTTSPCNVIATWQKLSVWLGLLIISWTHLTCCQKVETAFQRRTRESGISSVKARCQSPGGCKSERRIWFLNVVSMHRFLPAVFNPHWILEIPSKYCCYTHALYRTSIAGRVQAKGKEFEMYSKILPLADRGKWRIWII